LILSKKNNIVNNTASSNQGDGIKLSLSMNNSIKGNSITHNEREGIWIAYSSANTFENNTITGSHRDGIRVYESSHISFFQNKILNNSRDGIWHLGTTESIIVNNTFESDGILLFDNQVKYWNTHLIKNNSANGKPLRYYKNKENVNVPEDSGQVILANCKNCCIQNLTISDVDTGIQVGFCKDILILNNQISNNSQDGIRLAYSQKITVKGNHLFSDGITLWGVFKADYNTHTIKQNMANGKPIRFYKNTTNIIVPHNTAQVILANCTNCTIQQLNLSFVDTGIQLAHSNNNKIIENNASHNSRDGIWLSYSSYNILKENTVCHNNWDGIRVKFYCIDNSITENTVTNNDEYGIELYKSDRNYISNNSVISNIYDVYTLGIGIGIVSSNDNTINNNLVKDNRYGILVDGSKNNLVYHNQFVLNDLQASDTGKKNDWYDASIQQGNYWSDYSGDDGDGDGIGDTPYDIADGNNQDRYPLMKNSVGIISVSTSLGRIAATIQTSGHAMSCSIQVHGKVLIGGSTVVTLSKETLATIETTFTIGFGHVDINIKAGTFNETYQAFLLGPFFINLKNK
jgi:parallel beta-helix repeat protein